MLLKMDERISAAIDKMIAQRIRSGPKVFFGGTLDIDSSWFGEICNVSGEFASLADPDALEIIPGLADTFEKKKTEVMSMDLPEDLRDHILFEISSRRRQVGIDKRLRDILRGKGSGGGGGDVW